MSEGFVDYQASVKRGLGMGELGWMSSFSASWCSHGLVHWQLDTCWLINNTGKDTVCHWGVGAPWRPGAG